MKHEQVLIIGASGTVGTEIVKQLTSQGYQVRTTTSKATSKPNQVQVNLATGEGVKEAFTGIDRAFLLSPPGYADQYAMLSPLIQEAKRQGLKKVVLMSAMGANAVDTTPFRRAEIELEKSGLNYNIIRPNWFMQNFITFWLQGIKTQGQIALPVGQAKTSFIDARDISAVAAKLLVDDSFNNKDFDLTGPEALTHAEVAGLLSKELGKQVVFQDIAPEVLQSGLLQAGLPADYVSFLLLILGFLKEGYNARLTNNVKNILGREPSSFKVYAKDFISAF